MIGGSVRGGMLRPNFFSARAHRTLPFFSRSFFPSKALSSLKLSTSSLSTPSPSSTPSSSTANVPPALLSLGYRPIPSHTPSSLLSAYRSLSKDRLLVLVLLSAMSGYAVSPFPSSLPTFIALSGGTALLISSANAINQLVEAPYDAQMARTRNRVMVRRLLSPSHAGAFALITGTVGTGILATLVNPLTATLGAANLVLYSFIYTSLKRRTLFNTHVGSVVGAIPPLMGWAASTGTIMDWRAWIIPGVMYLWQFPHFNSLATTLKDSYAQAGYRMYASIKPNTNKAMAFRYAVLLLPLCSYVAPAFGLTSWAFAYWSFVPNSILVACSARWWWWGEEKWARYTFWASLIHLAVVLGLILLFKNNEKETSSSKDEILTLKDTKSLEEEGKRLIEKGMGRST